MGLEDITKRIIDDAEKEASKIRKEADNKAEEFIKEAQGETEATRAKSLGEAKEQAVNEQKRLLALARLGAKKTILSEKRQAVEAAYNKAEALLASLPQDKYRQFLKRTLLREATGNEEIIVALGDKDYFNQAFIDEVNAELRKSGKGGNLAVSSEVRKIKGGFILKSGGIEVDSSLDTLVNSYREDLEAEVVKILFS